MALNSNPNSISNPNPNPNPSPNPTPNPYRGGEELRHCKLRVAARRAESRRSLARRQAPRLGLRAEELGRRGARGCLLGLGVGLFG